MDRAIKWIGIGFGVLSVAGAAVAWPSETLRYRLCGHTVTAGWMQCAELADKLDPWMKTVSVATAVIGLGVAAVVYGVGLLIQRSAEQGRTLARVATDVEMIREGHSKAPRYKA